MAYNPELVAKIEEAVALTQETFTIKKMFGGIAFLYKGKMTVGVINDDLMVRVIGTKMESVLGQPHVRPMDFTGKPMKEFVFVSGKGTKTPFQIQEWVELGLEHAKSKLKV